MLESLIAYGWVALAGGVLCLLLLAFVPSARRLRLPPLRTRAVVWTGKDIAVVFLLLYGHALIVFVIVSLLWTTGVQHFLPGEVTDVQLKLRMAYLGLAITTPLLIAVYLEYLLRHRRAPAYQLGLSTRRWASNVVLGYLTFVILSPIVYAIMAMMVSPESEPVHEVARLLQLDLPIWERATIMVMPILLAPILEELVFRGILLPWQIQAAPISHVVVAALAMLASLTTSTNEEKPSFTPALFVAGMLLGYVALPAVSELFRGWGRGHKVDNPPKLSAFQRVEQAVMQPALDPRHGTLLAIWGNGLFFAALHSSSWPAPVPLLLLGCGLAWLRLRSDSLLSPIVVHVLFNCVAALELL